MKVLTVLTFSILYPKMYLPYNPSPILFPYRWVRTEINVSCPSLWISSPATLLHKIVDELFND